MKILKVMRRARKACLRESGQSLVEAAIAAPIFFLLLMGAGELARLAYSAIEIQNAAEAGALYAIETPSTMGDTSGMLAAAQADATNLSGVSIETPSYTYTCSDASLTPDNTTHNCTSGWTETSIHVTTSVTFDPVIHIPGLLGSFVLHGTAAERCEQC